MTLQTWEHLTRLTLPKNVEVAIKCHERHSWQVCGAIVKESGLVQLIMKRECISLSLTEEDQAFQDLIEHHRQHHLRDEAPTDRIHAKEDWQALVGEIEELKLIRSRAEKELERIKPGSAVWQALRYVLDID